MTLRGYLGLRCNLGERRAGYVISHMDGGLTSWLHVRLVFDEGDAKLLKEGTHSQQGTHSTKQQEMYLNICEGCNIIPTPAKETSEARREISPPNLSQIYALGERARLADLRIVSRVFKLHSTERASAARHNDLPGGVKVASHLFS